MTQHELVQLFKSRGYTESKDNVQDIRLESPDGRIVVKVGAERVATFLDQPWCKKRISLVPIKKLYRDKTEAGTVRSIL